MRKKSVVRLISAVMSVLLIMISCVACSNNEEKSSSDKETISIWAHDTSAYAAQKAVDLYLANHPDCKYEFDVQDIGQENMVNKINLYLSTNSLDDLPDMFYDEEYNFCKYTKYYTDAFMDLSNYVSADDFPICDYLNMCYDDKPYAVPFDCSTGALFYRIDLVSQAGYSEEDMTNLTWPEYIEIGKAVKAATGVDMIVACVDKAMETSLMVHSAATWYCDENGIPNIENNTAFSDVLHTYKSLFDADIVYPASGFNDYIYAISNNEVASLVGAAWWPSVIQEYKEQSGLWRVAEMPRMVGSSNYTNYSCGASGSWYVLNKENREFVAEFTKEMFVESQELADYMATEYLICPLNINLSENLCSAKSEFFGNQDVLAFFTECNKKIPSVKYGLNTYELTSCVANGISKYLDGSLTEEAALAQMQDDAERVVEQYE